MLSPLAFAISAHAAEFDWGEVSGRANGSISAGGIWNAETPDKTWIFQGNASRLGYGSAGESNPRGARNVDDGRLNFRKRDLVSSPVTLLGEIELNYRNYGAFLRGKAWYDYTLNNRKVDHGHSANGYQRDSKLDDSHFDDLAKFQGIELLDAYVFGDFDIADRPLHLRAGNQVVNWGEGLFFQNGLNAINPLDVAALRRPGSQLKEALLPVPLLYANLGLTDSLSLEAFYQLKWRETVLEGCGTYFASLDMLQDGCFGVDVTGAGNPNDEFAYANDLIVRRSSDDEPSDQGQMGMSLRYFAESIGTEFGAYAMNIHSRTPLTGAHTDLRPGAGPGWIPGLQASNADYFVTFPEDVRIFGLSFSTNVAGASVFGEYSYRPNQPVALFTGDTVPAIYGNPLTFAGLGAPLARDLLDAPPGSVVNGYDRLEVSQLSVGVLKTFPQVLGSDNLSLMGEVAMKYIHDLPGQDERRYGKPDLYGSNLVDGQGPGSLGCSLGVAPRYQKLGCSSDGFTTDFSWGYRLFAQLNYLGLFAGVNVSPYLSFGQDVQGWSYDSNFVEDRLLGSIGVKADYMQKYSADLSWSGTGNTPFIATDRDFIALSVRMGF